MLRGASRWLVPGAVWLAFAGAASAANTQPWVTVRQGMPTMWGSAFGASTYVLVGDFGEIWSSPDGAAWTKRVNPDPALRDLRGAAFGGGQFVAVGACTGCATGPVLRSADGINWTLTEVADATSLAAVTFGAGQYVAVGAAGRILGSPDGVAWTARTSNTVETLNGAGFGGGQFVAVGSGHEVVSSPDGSTWTSHAAGMPAAAGTLSGVAWAGGTFVAVGSGGIFTSAAAATWSATSVTDAYQAVAYTGSLFVAVPSAPIAPPAPPFPQTSPGGTSWTASSFGTLPPGLQSSFQTVTGGGPAVVGAGQGGLLLTSADGAAAWTSQTLDASRDLRGVEKPLEPSSSPLCAAGGGNAVARSTDAGLTWTNLQGASTVAWNALTRPGHQDAHLFVAVGTADASGRGGIMTSSDCVTWTDAMVAPPPGYSGYRLYDVQVAPSDLDLDYYIAVGEKYPTSGIPARLPFIVEGSSDGTGWNEVPNGLPTNANGHLTAIAVSSYSVVGARTAVGVNDETGDVYLTQSEPLAWSPFEQQVQTGLSAYTSAARLEIVDNGAVVLVGTSPEGTGIWSSPDGIHWTARQTGRFAGLAEGEGGPGGGHTHAVVAVGMRGAIASSADSGLTWTAESSSTPFDLAAVTFDRAADRFVALGPSVIAYAGNDYHPPPPPTIEIQQDAYVQEGAVGQQNYCSIQVTLSSPAGPAVSVNASESAGTAQANTDYVAVGWFGATFPVGSSTLTLQGPIIGDSDVEPDEYFFVSLSSPLGGVLGPNITGTCHILDDDAPLASHDELVAGSSGVFSLAAVGGVPAVNRFVLDQQRFSSYEAVVDGVTGDIAPVSFQLLGADGSTVMQTAEPVSGGSSLSLRWQNATPAVIGTWSLRVASGGCSTGCDANDVYRLSLYDTTYGVARFNNSATQNTFLLIQNPTGQTVTGHVAFWDAAGQALLVDPLPFSIGSHSEFVYATSQAVPGTSGSISIVNDAPYGALSGKGVALEPATAYTFDTPMLQRPR